MSIRNSSKKLGAFIIPTGIGASIGGYAGDAGALVREFSKSFDLIVNPNVVNAGGFSAITPNMLYVEGYSIDSFFKGEINLIPSLANKIGIIYDREIPQDVLNIHINTQNAVKTVYGIDILDYEITEQNVGVDFFLTSDGVSIGDVKNIAALDNPCEKLLKKGCDAIAVVCLFEDAEDDNSNYCEGIGVDPVGGVEAIISHYISKKYKVPAAHSPAFIDYSISSKVVSPKSASEYITPTFLPCILIGLSQAPLITSDLEKGINIKDLDFLVMPGNSLGSVPVYEAEKRNIPIYAVMENSAQTDIKKADIFPDSKNIIEIESYQKLLNMLL